MTCIVGLIHNDKVYLGGDSAGVSGYSITARGDHKVFTNGEFIMGFTSSFRMGQLLRYSFVPPPCNTWDIERYMTIDFVNAVRHCLKEGGFARVNSGEESAGTFLVGFKNRLFMIDGDYQVGWNLVPFNAVGCGQDLAIGAMNALVDIDLPPETKITKALEAAAAFSAGVAGPFNIVSTS
jgi:ATP-dependent protease HslVU (ClpYQ) peptidase subunit